MSELFHKSCYTSRSVGYKYRSLATNTGDKKRRDSKEDTAVDKKIYELKGDICTRINKEVEDAQQARKSIQEKFEKIDKKINSMIDIQNTITLLRNNLRCAEDMLVDTMEKIEKIENLVGGSESSSLRSRSSICKARNFQSSDTNAI